MMQDSFYQMFLASNNSYKTQSFLFLLTDYQVLLNKMLTSHLNCTHIHEGKLGPGVVQWLAIRRIYSYYWGSDTSKLFLGNNNILYHPKTPA